MMWPESEMRLVRVPLRYVGLGNVAGQGPDGPGTSTTLTSGLFQRRVKNLRQDDTGDDVADFLHPLKPVQEAQIHITDRRLLSS